MKALSSTTRTERRPPGAPLPNGAALEDTIPFLQRSDLDPSVVEEEMDAASVVAPHVLGDDRYTARPQRLPRRGDVAIADVDPAGRDQIGEHARAADELRADSSRVGAE